MTDGVRRPSAAWPLSRASRRDYSERVNADPREIIAVPGSGPGEGFLRGDWVVVPAASRAVESPGAMALCRGSSHARHLAADVADVAGGD